MTRAATATKEDAALLEQMRREREQGADGKASGSKKQKGKPTAEANGKTADKKEPAEEAPPRKQPEEFEAFYDSSRGCFWCINGKDQWQPFNTDAMTCMLKNRHYRSEKEKWETVTPIERFIHHVRFTQSVDWAGELAGWERGLHRISGLDVLVIRGRTPVVPAKGQFPLTREFLKTLLGREQLPYFLGWLAGSLQSLKEGYPFRPGQLVAFAGIPNCGKSFVQHLVTEILGGRIGDPTQYLLGETSFNGDFLRAEHLLVEDQALKDFSYARRRNFAANLKAMIVNSEQRIRGLFKEAVVLPVCMRVTLSCNDTPEALAILPALDSDVRDKVIYFHCGDGALPMRRDPSMTRKQQWDLFMAELPAFIGWLSTYKIPDSVRDPGNRFTVKAFHNDEIVKRLQDLTPEQRLLQLMEILPLKWPADGYFEGTAYQIEQWMREVDQARLLDRVLTYNASMGYLLSKIAKEGEERVKLMKSKDRKNVYRITKAEL